MMASPELPLPKLDTNFSWPAWLRDAWSMVNGVGQLIQRAIAGSTQER